MGKRYYCDYCERSFADGAENRKKHLASMIHQKLRKAHYDMFKDAVTVLEENKLKKPCRKFQNNGECEFGNGCKYSHLTPTMIQQLKEEAEADISKPLSSKHKIESDIDAWIQTKASKLKEEKTTNSTASNSVLGPVLANIPNLPPSLFPCSLLDTYHAQRNNDQEWG